MRWKHKSTNIRCNFFTNSLTSLSLFCLSLVSFKVSQLASSFIQCFSVPNAPFSRFSLHPPPHFPECLLHGSRSFQGSSLFQPSPDPGFANHPRFLPNFLSAVPVLSRVLLFSNLSPKSKLCEPSKSSNYCFLTTFSVWVHVLYRIQVKKWQATPSHPLFPMQSPLLLSWLNGYIARMPSYTVYWDRQGTPKSSQWERTIAV